MSDETAPALKLEVDAIEGIPEPIRPLYQQTEGGKYRLRVEGVEDVSGLKSALQKERTTRKELERIAGKWQSLGVDPDEVGKVLTERQAAEQKRLKDSGDFDALMNQVTERAAREKAELLKRLEETERAADRAIRDSEISRALTSAGVTKEGQRLISLEMERRLRTETDSGTRVMRALTEDGEIMLGRDNKPGTAEDLAKELRERYPMLFAASGASGGGKPQGNGVSANAGLSRSKMSAQEKAAFLDQNGQEAYFKLPK
jgi:DNA-binding transcriptional MerR regulator